MFYFAGQHFNTGNVWANPNVIGTLSSYRSSNETGSPSDLVDRTLQETHTLNVPGSWIAVDLIDHKAVVTTYALQNRNSADRAIRNWKLQGSNQNVSSPTSITDWTDLDVRVNDTTMPSTSGVWAAYSCSGVLPYRWIRLLQTGLNASGDDYLLLCEWELYGNLFGNVSPPSPKRLNYVYDGDTGGASYFIGTGFGLNSWANPTPGSVLGLFSTTFAGTPTDLTDRAVSVQKGTNNVANSYIAIDFGAGRSLQVNTYSLACGDSGRALRNFKLQGTNAVATWDVTGVNAATWTDIDVRVADTTMPAGTNGAWGTYFITAAGFPSAYRYLRILQNGLNSNSDNFLFLSEWEFYGSLNF
jgi:hypothetical protein